MMKKDIENVNTGSLSQKAQNMTSALRCLALGPALCRAFTIPTRPSFGGAAHITSMAMASSYSTSLENKVFLVTGSTDGIGRHTASRLAEAGATVLVHGRREATVRDAVKFVKSKGSEVSRVDGFVADISTLRGMNKLCDDVLARTDRLDCLINNAGVYQENLRHSDDGVEYTFAVNVLAPYVITGRLLDLIAKAPGGARVVNVASHVAAYSADFDNLQFEKGGYNGHAAYALSKLLDIMFNAELSRRAPRGVTCNSLHPGVVNTKMLREGWGVGGSRVTTANDQFHLATSEDVKDTTGKFFINRRTSTPPPPAQDKAACARLWGILEGISGFKYDT